MDAERLVVWMGGLIVRSLFVFAAGGLALLLLRRASASARHLVLALALGALLLLPAASALLPRHGVELLPAAALPLQPAVAETTTAAFAAVPAEGVVVAAMSPPAAEAAAVPPRWAGAALAAYAAGFALLAARRMAAGFRLAALAGHCEPVTDRDLLEAAQRAMDSSGVGRRTTLLHGPAGVSPATWGVRRPVLLLPADAAGWPGDRLRSVLLHEAAHARRGDALWSLFADAACIVWWFQPLAWWAAARMRREAEMACDDAALRAGVEADEYAGHLVSVARAAAGSRLPDPALAMARRAPVRERFDRVLDCGRDRRPVSGGLVAAAAGVAALATAVAGCVHPEARADETVTSAAAIAAAPATVVGQEVVAVASADASPPPAGYSLAVPYDEEMLRARLEMRKRMMLEAERKSLELRAELASVYDVKATRERGRELQETELRRGLLDREARELDAQLRVLERKRQQVEADRAKVAEVRARMAAREAAMGQKRAELTSVEGEFRRRAAAYNLEAATTRAELEAVRSRLAALQAGIAQVRSDAERRERLAERDRLTATSLQLSRKLSGLDTRRAELEVLARRSRIGTTQNH